MVVKFGDVSPNLTQLVRDLRCALAPNTYSHLRESKRTKLRDYVKAGKQLGASTLISVTKTDSNSYFKLGRLPEGPTSVFRLSEFSLSHDVRVSSRRPRSLSDRDLLAPPVLILHGFDDQSEISSILKSQFEQLVPSLDVQKVNPKLLRRVLLVSLDLSDDRKSYRINLRHFAISIRNTSVSRAVDKLLKSRSSSKKLAKLVDPADLLDLVSESELENDTLPISVSPAKFALHSIPKSASLGVKLVELGPRLDLDLVRVQDGLFQEGNDLFLSSSSSLVSDSAAIHHLQHELRSIRDDSLQHSLNAKRQRRSDLRAATALRKIRLFHQRAAAATPATAAGGVPPSSSKFRK